MIRRFRWVAFLLAAALVSAGCTRAPATTTETATPGPPSAFQQTVDALRAIQPHNSPYSFDRDVPRAAFDFDINQYFLVLKHLTMEPGYVLDYVYYPGYNGACPAIYARPAERAPFSTFSDYFAVTGLKKAYMETEDKVPGDRIRTDGTPEGYFEWVALQIMGGQFYLSWHAGYDDATVICDLTGLESLRSGRALPANIVSEARNIDFAPSVRIEAAQVTVRVVTFTEWGGFIEQTFTLSRDPPISVVGKVKRTLVPYDTGRRF